MTSSKLRLQVVGQVKIIDGENRCRKRMWKLAELFSKSRSLPKSREIRHRQWSQRHGDEHRQLIQKRSHTRKIGAVEDPDEWERLMPLSQGNIHIYVTCGLSIQLTKVLFPEP